MYLKGVVQLDNIGVVYLSQHIPFSTYMVNLQHI